MEAGVGTPLQSFARLPGFLETGLLVQRISRITALTDLSILGRLIHENGNHGCHVKLGKLSHWWKALRDQR
jgi:hypothetical protein